MSTAAEPATPLEESRRRVERYLTGRGGDSGGVAPLVRVLGERDLVYAAPEPPAAGLVIPVQLYDHAAIVGPLGPADGSRAPCFHCVAMRWQKLRQDLRRDVLELRGERMGAVAPMPHLTPFALEELYQLVRALAEPEGRSAERTRHGFRYVYELQLDTLHLRRHPIVADSTCPVCGPAGDDTRPAFPGLSSRMKPDPDSDRVRSVHEHDLALDAIANPACGMLGKRADAKLSTTTTATVSGHLAVRGNPRLLNFFWNGHADSYADSTLLAACEGLERYSGLIRGGTATAVVDSHANLSAPSVDPLVSGVHSDEFYATAPAHFTRYTPDLSIPWVWGHSLRDDQPVLVPEQCVYYLLSRNYPNFAQESSNGCASGGCLEEAILHGALEVIERDAFLLAWFGGAALPQIDPATVRDPATRALIDRMWLLGYDIHLLDTRIDLPFPVVTAMARRRPGGDGLGARCLSAAASFDPEEAVKSAVREVATYIADFPDRTARKRERLEPMTRDYSRVVDIYDHPALYGLPEMAGHTDMLLGGGERSAMSEVFGEWEHHIRPRTPDLTDDVRFCRDRLAEAGFDMVVVDQTSPEQAAFGTRTAAVTVPGMLPIDFGWDKQRAPYMPRMRTAFRRAGWRETDLDPSELHLVPHPFM
ncbi:ribosomal protein S12 methylthiotransferase accessory factor [Lipingzhangella halophila]|uniref:Ribosomal protein S12 methylthiotransferase accessory factor n=1 Tax=Lipingzhangella halophila TaxID=1783352 RepID=A0A7W7RGY0_9ACTN|nr:TOMM precursor leader peptide-binding protein [Lipingzhangella halophila]MBB4931772.1 ribosomal protein S12 methylthiotransferase accessory factor [Lipingzhangella halophila]